MNEPDEPAGDRTDDRTVDRADLDAYEVPPVPAGLEDRLWQRMAAADAPRPRRWKLAAGAVAVAAVAAAASVTWLVTARSHVASRSGAANTAERTTLSIDQATLVAEPGTALTWTSGEHGVRVEQRAGNVFYRVEHGQPFVVVTPVGELSVLGTCFRVEVNSMRLPKQGLVGGAIGAAITAGVFVAVFEGRVSLANDHGRVDVAAGESAQITAEGGANVGPPTKTSTNVVQLAPGAQPGGNAEPGANRPPATATAATATAAVSAFDQSRFSREVRDPQWAPAQEQAIQTRLEKYLGIPSSRFDVDCRTKCCRVRMAKSVRDEHERELHSSVGLEGGEPDSALGYGEDPAQPGMVAEDVCFPRDGSQHAPDRGAEREALLSAIHGELAACGRGLTHEVAISVELTLDESGAVTKAVTRPDPMTEPAAACVERLVVGSASFGPGSAGSWLPVNVTLPLR